MIYLTPELAATVSRFREFYKRDPKDLVVSGDFQQYSNDVADLAKAFIDLLDSNDW